MDFKDKNYFKPGETYVSTVNAKVILCVRASDEQGFFKSITSNKQRNHHFGLHYCQLQNYVNIKERKSGD